jgi:hypothetical protein
VLGAVALGLIGAAVALPSAAQSSAAAPATVMERAMEAAMEDYAVQRFDAAFVQLTRLADEGHPQAARIAWLMVRHSRTLYGRDWSASQERLALWAAAALPEAQRQQVALGGR